ncbi:hypothetical protein D5R40_08670 [Okeania hirsuta]|uniref:Uncharacterized protein n=1 Tax=Okeania hirsuta TaxID=1458930 RepID=A0A3N6PG37_9CYAN|nr:hypothetical protein D4Z78_24040 [Okeania hirsuta]RQH47485.1 hypothetical protein D5R40_08670 [Okeania hirsuta]
MRVFLALSQERGERRQEVRGKREEGKRKREDVGRNNTKNSTLQSRFFLKIDARKDLTTIII